MLYPYAVPPDLLIHAGIRGATRVIAQTDYQRQRIKENFGKDAIILPSLFPQPGTAVNPAKEPVVLWLANINRAKQPEAFLHLARGMNGLGGWRFVLGGGASDRGYWRELEHQARELECIEMIGAVPFAASNELFARARLFVNTSTVEADGVPNAFIQAWLHGTPTLSLNHDPNGWIASEGLGFCAHGDLDAFVSRGTALLAEPETLTKLSKACTRFARKTFASDDVIDRYLQVFAGS